MFFLRLLKPNFQVALLGALFLSVHLHAEDEFFKPTTTIGGYGELHLNYLNPETGSASPMKADFHRWVLFFGHAWTPEWSMKSEIELEHNFVPSGVEEKGELELEQAYIEYKYSTHLLLKMGVLLPAIGLYNEYHEPPLFNSVERPEYQRSIIPTTWFGNGIGLSGAIDQGLRYSLIVMEGLNMADIGYSNAIRSGRQEGFEASLENILINSQIEYTAIPGLRTGVSYSRNQEMKADESPYDGINILEAHGKYDKSGVLLSAEAAYIGYTTDGTLSDSSQEASMGYYVEAGYDIGVFIPGEARMIPWVRFCQIQPSYEIKNEIFADKTAKDLFHTGVSILPIPQIAIKTDIGWVLSKAQNKDYFEWNIGVGYQF